MSQMSRNSTETKIPQARETDLWFKNVTIIGNCYMCEYSEDCIHASGHISRLCQRGEKRFHEPSPTDYYYLYTTYLTVFRHVIPHQCAQPMRSAPTSAALPFLQMSASGTVKHLSRSRSRDFGCLFCNRDYYPTSISDCVSWTNFGIF